MNKVKASLVMLGVTACALGGMLAPAAARHAQPTERAAAVRTVRVVAGDVEQLLAVSGSLRYTQEYAALSPASGVVAQVYVRPGERVTAGQPLFRLDGEAQAEAVSAALTSQDAVAEVWPAPLAQTSLQQASAALESLTVRAAADGFVQQVNIAPYGGVAAGTPAVALAGGDQAVRCSVVLRDAERLRAGMQARILKDDVLLTLARVEDIGLAQVNPATGQTVCQVSLAAEERIALPLGALVDVEIVLQGQSGVPTLPVEAITPDSTVWWVSDDRCYEVPVTAFLADEERCWVSLKEGAVVALGSDLAQGQRVKEAGQ